MTVTGLATVLGVGRSIVYRLVATLEGRTAYVVTDGELQSGAHGIAVPIVGVAGLLASSGVVSMVPLNSETVGPQVSSAAQAVTSALR